LTEYEIVTAGMCGDDLHGRTKILTNKRKITRENVVEVVAKARTTHQKNKREIQYLFDVYRGKQDIQHKVKSFRPEINNKITVNRANEIVTFKSSFSLFSPIQYVSAVGEDSVGKSIKQLNEYMRAEKKDSKDKQLFDWINICGVSPRMALPKREFADGQSPFHLFQPDPREVYTIYHSGLGQFPLANVIEQKDEDGQGIECVYTHTTYYEIKNGEIVTETPHTIGLLPVVEYLNNDVRMGSFEIVLSLLNEMNMLASTRLDDIMQYVQSILVFKNCEINQDQMEQLKQQLGLMIKDNGQTQSDVFRVEGELSQAGAQTVMDDAYEAMLTICGMPNRNGGSSTSDTGQASYMRDGWASAESRAKDTENMYNMADEEMLAVILKICEDTVGLKLNVSDIKIEHGRNNLANIQSRMQVLCEGLNNSKIHPMFPWIASGMPNAQEWYHMSMKWYEEQQQKAAEQMAQTNAGGEEQPDGEQDEQQEQTA